MTMRMRTHITMTSTAAFAADAFSCARAAFNTAILLLDAASAASIFVALLVVVSLLGLLNITLISLLVLLVVLLIPVRLKR